jgi:hypothetical protein
MATTTTTTTTTTTGSAIRAGRGVVARDHHDRLGSAAEPVVVAIRHHRAALATGSATTTTTGSAIAGSATTTTTTTTTTGSAGRGVARDHHDRLGHPSRSWSPLATGRRTSHAANMGIIQSYTYLDMIGDVTYAPSRGRAIVSVSQTCQFAGDGQFASAAH